jgi:hypothetical protein
MFSSCKALVLQPFRKKTKEIIKKIDTKDDF